MSSNEPILKRRTAAVPRGIGPAAPIKEAKTIFFTTGAEATENAVKIARAHTGRPGIITFTRAFHGRTQLTMSMAGKAAPHRTRGKPPPSADFHTFKADIEPSNVAAIVIEPVQGEGGFCQTPLAFMRNLREICDEYGICLVADEVQSGFARTGKMFAIEHYGIEPDLIPIAKALGGGFPISGLIGRADIMDSAEPGEFGGTYSGDPISVAATLAVLDVIEDENLCDRANTIGAVVASEPVKQRSSLESDPDAVKAVTALDEGLILQSRGCYSNAIRILSPLTIETGHLHEGLEKLEVALEA